MLIAQRIRELRESKKLRQSDIEKRTGLLRYYLSRVENGHTIPSVQTLEKIARALDIPLYKLFYDGQTPANGLHLSGAASANSLLWGANAEERRELKLFAKLFSRMGSRKRDLLMKIAATMADPRFQSK